MVKPTRRPIAVLVLVLSLAACVAAPFVYDKDKTLQTKSIAEVKRQVKAYADAVSAQLGIALKGYNAVRSPCEGRGGEIATGGQFFMLGAAQLALPSELHLATLQRMHDEWKAKGYEVRDFRTFKDGARGTAAARNPVDRFEVSLESTVPPDALALLVFSDCYMAVAGEEKGAI